MRGQQTRREFAMIIIREHDPTTIRAIRCIPYTNSPTTFKPPAYRWTFIIDRTSITFGFEFRTRYSGWFVDPMFWGDDSLEGAAGCTGSAFTASFKSQIIRRKDCLDIGWEIKYWQFHNLCVVVSRRVGVDYSRACIMTP